VDTASFRPSGAHGCLEGRKRSGWPTSMNRNWSSRARLTGRDLRPRSEAIGAQFGRGQGDQLGEGSFRARSVFVRDDRNARSAVGAFDVYRRAVFYSGEALYRGRDMGTVEAALASGLETARTVLRT